MIWDDRHVSLLIMGVHSCSYTSEHTCYIGCSPLVWYARSDLSERSRCGMRGAVWCEYRPRSASHQSAPPAFVRDRERPIASDRRPSLVRKSLHITSAPSCVALGVVRSAAADAVRSSAHCTSAPAASGSSYIGYRLQAQLHTQQPLHRGKGRVSPPPSLRL